MCQFTLMTMTFLARTSTICPGRDNVVRIVELKTVCARSTSMENVLA